MYNLSSALYPRKLKNRVSELIEKYAKEAAQIIKQKDYENPILCHYYELAFYVSLKESVCLKRQATEQEEKKFIRRYISLTNEQRNKEVVELEDKMFHQAVKDYARNMRSA